MYTSGDRALASGAQEKALRCSAEIDTVGVAGSLSPALRVVVVGLLSLSQIHITSMCCFALQSLSYIYTSVVCSHFFAAATATEIISEEPMDYSWHAGASEG